MFQDLPREIIARRKAQMRAYKDARKNGVAIIFNVCLGAGSRQYCRYTKSPLGITPLKEIWESPRVNENLTSVGFGPTTSGLDLPMLYRLSYKVSTGADWGNLGSESRLMYK